MTTSLSSIHHTAWIMTRDYTKCLVPLQIPTCLLTPHIHATTSNNEPIAAQLCIHISITGSSMEDTTDSDLYTGIMYVWLCIQLINDVAVQLLPIVILTQSYSIITVHAVNIIKIIKINKMNCCDKVFTSS